MAFDFPLDLYFRVQQEKNRNQQNAADLASQGIQSLGDTIGTVIKKHKQNQLMQQLQQLMKNQGAPQQGPAIPQGGVPQQTMIPPGQPMSAGGNNIGQDVSLQPAIPAPSNPPSSGMGAAPADNTQQINALLMKLDPTSTISNLIQQRFPPPSKQTSPWRVVPGMLSKTGKPVQENEQTGEVREGNLDVTPTGRGSSSFGVDSINWNNASQEDKDLAKAIYEGNVRPYDLGYRDRSIGTKLANEYAIQNGLPPFQSYSGDVHAGTAKAFAFGKPGMNVLSLNTALGHTKSAMDAYDAVGNLDVRLLNTPLNKIREQINDPNIIKLQTALNALQGELATVFKGTAGTDQEIGHWMHVLSQDLTPKQAIGAIEQIGDLLNSRLDALSQMRESGMGKPAGSPLLSPHAKTVSDEIRKRGKGLGSGKSNPTYDPDKEARYRAWKKANGYE